MFSSILLVLFLMAFTLVGAVRLRPDVIPGEIADYLSPLQAISIPYLDTASQTPTSLPTATREQEPAALTEPTLVPATGTVAPTRTSAPSPTATVASTSTPANTPLPQATLLGGGLGQVAFASERTGMPQLFISSVDGTNLVQLTNLAAGACQPSWSPDGSQLVFVSPCQQRVDMPS